MNQVNTETDTDGPYLFDVGVIALAHAGTPVSDSALQYVRQALAGEISAVVPHSALIGAQHILRRVYRYSWDEAARLVGNFRDGKRVYWHDGIPESVLRAGLTISGSENIDGWDGYYAAVARSEGVETVLSLDDDFERVDNVACEVILTDQQAKQLNTYIESL